MTFTVVVLTLLQEVNSENEVGEEEEKKSDDQFWLSNG